MEEGFDEISLVELRGINESAFCECSKDNYSQSLGNPQFIYDSLICFLDEKKATKLTGILSFLYAEIQALYTKAVIGEEFSISVVSQLYLECFGIAFEDEDIDNKIKYLYPGIRE